MAHTLIDTGGSRSFPERHPLLASAQAAAEGAGRRDGSDDASAPGDVLVIIGANAGAALRDLRDADAARAILVELGTEPLGVYTGEHRGEEGSNVLGFARFRLGDSAPTNLIELVRQPRTMDTALEAARAFFESCGLQVAVCGDFDGRIIDRLVRPYYNAALRRLDERLASADDLDTTLRLGLGYPEGPIALLERTGLAHHHDVTQALYEALGDPAYAPARRARVAKLRSGISTTKDTKDTKGTKEGSDLPR